MNRYLLYACFGLIIGCSAPKAEKTDINTFLKLWAKAFSSKDNMVKDFYDPAFEFPTVLVEDAANLSYNLDMDKIELISKEGGDIFAVVPFQLRDAEGQIESGKMKLTIGTKTGGFFIKDMSQELTIEVMWRNRRLQYDQDLAQRMKSYDSIWNNVNKTVLKLQQYYDTVGFFTKVEEETLFYVANGNWVYPYSYYDSAQHDSGNYKMGVVTAENKVIVPVEYTKIYNPGGTIAKAIEVERKGLRGLFKVTGEQIIPAEYEGIYPTKAANAMAQLKKGDRYGWLDTKGNVSFDVNSHNDKTLFISPIESNVILDWQFTFPGFIDVLIDIHGNSEESTGIIVYPSFVHDLGITKIAHPWVINNFSELGMGMTNTEIKFEHSESLSEKLYGLISLFMESGVDARGYQFSINDLVVLDKTMTKIDRLENLVANSDQQDPCGNLRSGPAYRIISKGLYESNDGEGKYNYYTVTSEGNVELQATNRKYAFTKFVKIDEGYFENCRYENVPYESEANQTSNVVVVSGISYDDLDIMRNEIFAEYGFIFKTPKWKEYFSAMPWYRPEYDNVDQFLTETDKANIKFILEYQSMHKDKKVKRDSIMFGWAG